MNPGACPPDCACDCCTGIERRTPLSIANPPAQAALSYRVGSYGDFFSSMLASIASTKVPQDPAAAASFLGRILSGRLNLSASPSQTPLAALTTRLLDDPSIAFFDAWAVVLDVLTFYQERLANEGFLRTAKDPASVRELARLVNYTPSPGVASSVFLAYTLQQGPPVLIPAGSRALSTPGPGQQAQSFETSADLNADPSYNALPPRWQRPQVFQPGQTTASKRVFFQGLTTQLKPNDPLVLAFDSAPGEAFRVKSVAADNPNQRTTVVLQDFAAVPVLVDRTTAIHYAVNAATTAIAAYHAAEPVQIGATIKIASAVRNALYYVAQQTPPDTIQGELKLAIDAVNQQIAYAADLQNNGVPLGQAPAALRTLVEKLTGLQSVTDNQEVQTQAAQALTDFTAALALGADYQDAAVAIFNTTSNLSQQIHSALKSSDPVSAILFALRLNLIALRNPQASLAGSASPLSTRLDGLVARLETAEDRLLLQNVSERISSFSPPCVQTPDGVATIQHVQSLWSAGAIHLLSPVNLANQLYAAIDYLTQRLDDVQVSLSEGDRTVLDGVRQSAHGYLYSALISILRQILNRFYYPQQAGVVDDTRLAHETLQAFSPLRTILNPTPPLVTLVADFISQLSRQIHNLGSLAPVEPLTNLLSRVQEALTFYTTSVSPDLTKLNTDILTHLVQYGSARDAYKGVLDDTVKALNSYLQAPEPSGPVSLPQLKDAITALLRRSTHHAWITQQLNQLNTVTGNRDPFTDIGTFAATFQNAVTSIEQTLATTTANAASLLDYLPAFQGAANLLTKTQDLLITARRDQCVAQQGQYPRVGPWLDELVDALARFSGDFEMKPPPTPDQATTDLLQEQSSGQTAPLDPKSLPQLASLSKAPSATPSSPYKLRRQIGLQPGDSTSDPEAAFLDDVATQLAAAFNPDLGDSVYSALRNTVTRRTRRFQGIHAFRARSAPYGHNAPPRTIFGPAGGVLGTTEWPLGSELASVRIFPAGGDVLQRASFVGAAVEVHFQTPTKTYASYFTIRNESAVVSAGAPEVSVAWSEKNKTLSISLPGALLTKLDLTLAVDRTLATAAPQVSVTQTVGGTVAAPLTCDDGKDAARLNSDGSYLALGYNLRQQRVLSIVSEVSAGLRGSNLNVLRLDSTNDRLVPGGYVLVQRAAQSEAIVARIEAVATVSPTDYGLTATVTQLTLDKPWLNANDTSLAAVRNVTVYVQSEELALVGEPVDADVEGGQLELDNVAPGLKPGRWLIVAGERTDMPGFTGVQAAEVVMLAAATQVLDAAGGAGQGDPHTLLRLATPLSYSYQRAATTIWANVVKATQGETRSEILGSGNPAVADQSFALKQGLLTFLPAPVPSGVAAALQVRANGVLWHETDRLLSAGPKDRVYFLRLDEQSASVVFGDGVNGSRLPAGADNVRAQYRIGLGTSGNLPAGRINQLATRPLGVAAVVNPVAATGGADPEGPRSARRNAPLGVTAMGRLVSVDDYADFARGFVGIVKAYATRISDGFVVRLHLTLAGQDGDALDPQSDLYKNLILALNRFGDPGLPLTVASRRLRFLVFAASLRIDPDYQFDDVAPQATALLKDAYGFDQREFAEDVVLSEVVALLQSVAGVVAVRADGFGLVDESQIDADGDPIPAPIDQLAAQIQNIAQGNQAPPVLPVYGTRRGVNSILAAEIAVLSSRVPQTLILNEWTS